MPVQNTASPSPSSVPGRSSSSSNGSAAFTANDKRRKADATAKDRQIAALQDKLQRKHEVLSELMEEHVQLKKELGEP
jgi:transposase